MKEPRWLLRETVLALQALLIYEHGGLAGLRDEGLLASSLSRPQNAFAYGTPDLFELASAYASGIVRNHPFLDGNKRTAFLAAYTFLSDNGWDLRAPESEVVHRMIALAEKEESETRFAAWLRARSARASGSRRPSRSHRKPRKRKT